MIALVLSRSAAIGEVDLSGLSYRCDAYAEIPDGVDVGSYWRQPFTLRDGEAHQPPPCDGCSGHDTVRLIHTYPGTDGKRVALVADSGGGSGTAMYAFVFHGARCEFAAPLGDRVRVAAVRADRTRLSVDLLTRGPNDAACCPTMPTTVSFDLPSRDEARIGKPSPTPSKRGDDTGYRALEVLVPRETLGQPMTGLASANSTIRELRADVAEGTLVLSFDLGDPTGPGATQTILGTGEQRKLSLERLWSAYLDWWRVGLHVALYDENGMFLTQFTTAESFSLTESWVAARNQDPLRRGRYELLKPSGNSFAYRMNRRDLDYARKAAVGFHVRTSR